MQLFLRLLSFVAFSVLALPVTALAEYFFDQGLQTAVVRTDYDALDEGTLANPITMSDEDVLYPCSDFRWRVAIQFNHSVHSVFRIGELYLMSEL